MSNGSKPRVLWMEAPEDHDYAAAEKYLSLIMDPKDARQLARRLKARGDEQVINHYAAKDILRASELPLLPLDNAHVRTDLDKIARGEKLSPLLLVRGDGTSSQYPLIVADGYHRACASYHTDENTRIPVVII